MSTEPITDAGPHADDDAERKKNRYHFARHDPGYRDQFEVIAAEMVDKCPVAWSAHRWRVRHHHRVDRALA